MYVFVLGSNAASTPRTTPDLRTVVVPDVANWALAGADPIVEASAASAVIRSNRATAVMEEMGIVVSLSIIRETELRMYRFSVRTNPESRQYAHQRVKARIRLAARTRVGLSFALSCARSAASPSPDAASTDTLAASSRMARLS
jgi:hypothetical protein